MILIYVSSAIEVDIVDQFPNLEVLLNDGRICVIDYSLLTEADTTERGDHIHPRRFGEDPGVVIRWIRILGFLLFLQIRLEPPIVPRSGLMTDTALH
jgi:hypothetical protein